MSWPGSIPGFKVLVGAPGKPIQKAEDTGTPVKLSISLSINQDKTKNTTPIRAQVTVSQASLKALASPPDEINFIPAQTRVAVTAKNASPTEILINLKIIS